MKFSVGPLLLATVVVAAPADNNKRQLGKGKASGGGGSGSLCLVFARGSTEPSPLGLLIGPQLQTALKRKFPSMITVPVLYAASIATNVSVQRTDQASINKGVQAFQEANGKCKVLIAGGYSQGAAVMHNVIEKALSADIKRKIAGVALYGDTRNKQDAGHIKNFPNEKSKVWCNSNDGVCGGGLNVNAGHLSYGTGTIRESSDWLAARVSAHKGGASSGSEEASEEAPAPKAKSPKASKGKSSGAAPKTGKSPKAAAPKSPKTPKTPKTPKSPKTPKAKDPAPEPAAEPAAEAPAAEAPAEEAAAAPAAEEAAAE